MRYFAARDSGSGIAAALLLALSSSTVAAGEMDYCSYPNIVSALEEGLHKTAGQEGASLRDIVTVSITGLDTPTNPHAQPSSVCHATLMQSDGKSAPGRIVVSLTYDGALFSRINIEDITWISDSDFEKKRTEQFENAKQRTQEWLQAQQRQQDQLARCDPTIRARYDAMISPLANLSVYYDQHPSQGFLARNDINRRIMQLRAEEAQVCNQKR